MKLLRQSDRGVEVERWQQFLRGQGFTLLADGDFGPKTHEATLRFQARQRLRMDGLVGGRTIGKALMLGFGLVEVPGDADTPPPPINLRPLRGNAERQRLYGRFSFEPAPTAKNPEAIKILGSWRRTHIERVQVPELAGIRKAPVPIHTAVAHSFLELWSAWGRAGLVEHVRTWNGSFVPRFIRGSSTTLSNHSWGTAFDLNARWNRLGTVPALRGEPGSVRDLVAIANDHGWYWGGHFKRRDGMHFEIGVRT